MVNIYLTFHRDVLDLRFGPENLEALRRLGNIVLNESPKPLGTEQLIEAACCCEVILADRLTPGRAELFDNSPHLVAFVRGVTDVREVDVEAATRNGILVTRAGPAFIPAVVEWILAQMINLSRLLPEFIATYRAGKIPDLALGRNGKQLAGKTTGIIGYGQIGRSLGEVLTALDMRVLAYDPYVEEWPAKVDRMDFDRLLSASDFVICLAKYTDETENMIDAAVFRRMKSTAFFINAARGGLVEDAALEEALRHGQIAGAALDVGGEAGDVPPVRLGRLPNVLATPHMAAGFESNRAQGRQAVEMVAEILQGRIPDRALNAEHATRMSRLSAHTH